MSFKRSFDKVYLKRVGFKDTLNFPPLTVRHSSRMTRSESDTSLNVMNLRNNLKNPQLSRSQILMRTVEKCSPHVNLRYDNEPPYNIPEIKFQLAPPHEASEFKPISLLKPRSKKLELLKNVV